MLVIHGLTDTTPTEEINATITQLRLFYQGTIYLLGTLPTGMPSSDTIVHLPQHGSLIESLLTLITRRSEELVAAHVNNMFYFDPVSLFGHLQKDMAFMFDQYGRASDNLLYIKNAKILQMFTNKHKKPAYLGRDLYLFWLEHKDLVQLLPIHWQERDELGDFRQFSMIFDNHAIGELFLNSNTNNTVVTYGMYQYRWEQGRPQIWNGTWINIANLHISKDRRLYSTGSTQPLPKITEKLNINRKIIGNGISNSNNKKLMKLANRHQQLHKFFSDAWGDDRVVMYNMLQFLHNTFKEHNIDYFIISGTLLGYVRHHDLIPWDDDCDVMIFERDIAKLEELKGFFKENSIELRLMYHHHLYKFSRNNVPKIDQRSWSFPFIDIFVAKESETSVIFYNKHFAKEEIYPISQATFGPAIAVNIPARCKEVLYKNFNTRCLTHCVSSNYCHRKEHGIAQCISVMMEELVEFGLVQRRPVQ